MYCLKCLGFFRGNSGVDLDPCLDELIVFDVCG